jgi:hypothetical protein
MGVTTDIENLKRATRRGRHNSDVAVSRQNTTPSGERAPMWIGPFASRRFRLEASIGRLLMWPAQASMGAVMGGQVGAGRWWSNLPEGTSSGTLVELEDRRVRLREGAGEDVCGARSVDAGRPAPDSPRSDGKEEARE